MNKRRYLFTTCPGGNPGNEARVYAAIQNLYVDTYLQVLKRVFCLLHAPGVNSEVSGPCELFPWTSGTAELELKGAEQLHQIIKTVFMSYQLQCFSSGVARMQKLARCVSAVQHVQRVKRVLLGGSGGMPPTKISNF